MSMDATQRSAFAQRDQPVALTAPPYVSYSTFRTLLEWLRAEGVPLQFDRSFWRSKFSGSNGTQLVAALRFLGLLAVDEPLDDLERLVDATFEERRVALAEVLRASYLAVSFEELPRATPSMVRGWFKAYPIDGHTLRKAVSFFVNAAKDADLPISNAVTKMAKTRSAGRNAASTNVRPGLPKVVLASRRSAPEDTTTGAGQVARAHENQRTVSLESGGTVTLALDVDLFSLSDRDREFVLELVGLTRGYEERLEGPPGDTDEDPE